MVDVKGRYPQSANMERVVAAAAGGFVSAVSAGARACQGTIACARRMHAQQ
jgi:hypothetical protein